jgi:hypothetical protein
LGLGFKFNKKLLNPPVTSETVPGVPTVPAADCQCTCLCCVGVVCLELALALAVALPVAINTGNGCKTAECRRGDTSPRMPYIRSMYKMALAGWQWQHTSTSPSTTATPGRRGSAAARLPVALALPVAERLQCTRPARRKLGWTLRSLRLRKAGNNWPRCELARLPTEKKGPAQLEATLSRCSCHWQCFMARPTRPRPRAGAESP